MIAWLLSALDRLPPRARRVAVVVVALLAIAVVMAALTLTPSPVGGGRPRRAPLRAPANGTSPRTARQRVPPPVSTAELLRARQAAERFLGSYLPFDYGRASALAVSPVTPTLRGQLTGERARITPVERRRHPRVASLQVVGLTPGFVLATAIVEDGAITAYRLRFTLQGKAGRWAVSSVGEG
jgi:hypothetical protein